MRFFIFTADHSGIPLALRLRAEGHEPIMALIRPEERCGKIEVPKTAEDIKKNRERTQYLLKNGTGLVDKIWASEAMSKISPRDFAIFDQIYGHQYQAKLASRGIPVLGGQKAGYTLETERRDTLAMLKKLGMDVPLQKYFGQGSSQAGLKFLQQIGDQMLFVFKSDNPKVQTQVAFDSNDELVQKFESEAKDIDSDGFLLQQKVEGTEFAVETWYQRGKPVLANVDIEAKKKYNEMSEVQTGCSFGLTWPIEVKHPLRERVNGPIDRVAEKFINTGLLDLSVIYDEKEDKMWCLEVCGSRFAYNAFYALIAQCKMDIGEFFMKFLKGQKVTDAFDLDCFGASLRVFNDDRTSDQRISIDRGYEENCWLWDVYKKGKDILTVGTELGESLGIVTGVGENPEAALAKLRENYFHLHMPTKWARDRFDEDDEDGLPLARYHKLKRAKMI